MSKKSKKNQPHSLEKAEVIIRAVVVAIATGMLGFFGSWLFDGRVVLSLVVLGFLCVGCIVAWLISYLCTRRIDVLAIMDDDIRKNKHESTVKFGISVSRALHLSGRNWERFKIAEKVCDALKALPADKEIKVHDRVERVSYLRAKILLDDCGWALYSINPMLYRKKAERKIMEGISACVRMMRSDEPDPKVCETAFVGFRHLFGMVVENFEREGKDKLAQNQPLLAQYIEDCQTYGGLLGYFLGDVKMYDSGSEEQYRALFDEITLGADAMGVAFDRLTEWARGALSNPENKKFRQSTFNFRSKYFYTMYKAMRLMHGPGEELVDKYWRQAKEMALKFALGYARKEADIDFLRSTFYAADVEKYRAEWFIYPDSERMVKSILLLGKVAMVREKASYISAQKNIIAVNERMLNLELGSTHFDDEAKLEKLEEVLSEMDRIQKECQETAPEDFVDNEMDRSCKHRRANYKKLMRKYKSGKADI